MKIVTILFTYKRYIHTERVLQALSKNVVLPEKLLIFQDGIKKEDEREEWARVNYLINHQSFCPTEVIASSMNKGLAKSVIEGVLYALRNSDAVIVLEDDCVPSKTFIHYMNEMLYAYEGEDNIWGISGYAWPGVVNSDSNEDVYFGGRISSWGWATWKGKWKRYSRDIQIVNRIRRNKDDSIYLSRWGNDLDSMLRDQIKGENDSWAVYWALNMIEEHGLYVMPYKSQIKNIGLDDSGENCSSDSYKIYNVELEKSEKMKYNLPDKICINEKAEGEVRPLFGSYLENQERDDTKINAIVYGIGRCLYDNEKIISEKCNVNYYMDKYKTGYHIGKRILSINELKNEIDFRDEKDWYIVIALYDEIEIIRIQNELTGVLGKNNQQIISLKQLQNM